MERPVSKTVSMEVELQPGESRQDPWYDVVIRVHNTGAEFARWYVDVRQHLQFIGIRLLRPDGTEVPKREGALVNFGSLRMRFLPPGTTKTFVLDLTEYYDLSELERGVEYRLVVPGAGHAADGIIAAKEVPLVIDERFMAAPPLFELLLGKP